MFQNMSKYNFTVKCLNGKNDAEAKIPYGIILWKPLCVGALVTFRRNRRFFVLLKRNVDKVEEACEWKETRTWSICYIFRILKLCSFDS